MNEEIEYAEMLEIPVSTVNIVRKKSRHGGKKTQTPTPRKGMETDLKGEVIAKVNERLDGAENENAEKNDNLLFTNDTDIPERIDTVRLFSDSDYEKEFGENDFFSKMENDVGRYALNKEKPQEKRARIILGAEFAVACALCGAIFLTNVFMPSSAINTFFKTLENGGKQAQVSDTRVYSDFTLTGVVNDFSEVEMTLSPTGVLSFTGECFVYPTADGKVHSVTENADGSFTVKLVHSDSFTGIIDGLQSVYYAEGDTVKSRVPVGFTNGEHEVRVTMYSEGELLNCFRLTEENCLAWAEAQ